MTPNHEETNKPQPPPSFEELMGTTKPDFTNLMSQEEAVKTNKAQPLPSFNEIMKGETSGGQLGTVTPEAEKKDNFSSVEYIANKSKLGMASILSLAGIPIDFINDLQFMAIDLFGINIKKTPSPFGFEATKKAYEKILFADFDQETENIPLRVGGTIAEFAGGGLLPGAGLVSKAPTVAQKLLTATAELTSAVGAGVGNEFGGLIGEGVNEDYRPVGEVFGTIVGATTPYFLPTALRSIYTKISGFLTPSKQKLIGRENAANSIRDELLKVDDAMTELAEGERLRENIPGYSPSLGMETNAMGIKTMEKRFAETSQESQIKALRAETRSLVAIETKAKETFPEVNYNLTSIPEERLSLIREKFKDEISLIDKDIEKLAATIKKGNPENIGKQLRVLRNQKEQLARSVKNTLYEDFYRIAEDSNVTISAETIRDISKRILGDKTLTFQKKSPVLQKIISKYVDEPIEDAIILDVTGKPLTKPPEDISIREFHSLYKEINRELGIAYKGMQAGDQGAGSLFFQLRQMKGEFANNLDLMKAPEFGAVADKLNKADGFYINQYQKVFREGVGGRMDAYNRFGDVTPDEKIVKDLVLGRDSGIDDFYKIYGESKEAQTLLDNGILDMFARVAIKNGVYQPTQAMNFINKFDDTLTKLPALKATIIDKVKVQQALANRQLILNNKVKGLQKSKLQQLTNSNNTEELVIQAMDEPKKMLALKRSVDKLGGKDGAMALRFSVADNALKQTDPFEYFLKNEKQMKTVYGDTEYFKILRDLSKARRILTQKFKTERIDSSLQARDPLKELTGTSTTEAFTLVRWARVARISVEYVVTQIGSKMAFKFRQEEMNRLMEQAFYDPEVAKLLLKNAQAGIKGTDEGQFITAIRDGMFSIGVKASIAATPKDELLED